MTPEDYTDAVTWKSTNNSVASVDADGKVTAKGAGTASIRVNVGNYFKDCKVTVVQSVSTIQFSLYSKKVEALETFALNPVVLPNDANDKRILWSSTDDTVASVDDGGVVTARKKGTAIITATAMDGSGVTRSCEVTVKNNVYICTSVNELESSHNYDSNSEDLWIYSVIGADKLVITFDENTCVEEGYDYIYLLDKNDNKVGTYTGSQLSGQTVLINGDTVKIRFDTDVAGTDWGFKVSSVDIPVDDIAFEKESYILWMDETLMPITTILPTSHTEKVSWRSDDETVATVSDEGLVTPVAVGTTRITAYTSSTTSSFEVFVCVKPVSIELNKNSLELTRGDEETLFVTILPEGAMGKKIEWKSSNESVATVDQNGKITTLKKGYARITCKVDGLSAVCSVTVTPQDLLGNVEVTGATKYGETLTVTVNNSNNTGTLKYVWKRGLKTISGATNASYELVTEDIGQNITCIVYSTEENGALVKTIGIISKADGPSAPSGLTSVTPSFKGEADGKIIGVAKGMEYSTVSDFRSLAVCTGTEIVGLAAGNYYVRVAATKTTNAGAYTVVVIEDGPERITTNDMHRLYNPNSGEHFYTSSSEERDNLISYGWIYEGVAWTAPVVSNTPVYRLYNPNAGDHHYTPSDEERDNLIAAGWNYEGIGWYSDDEQGVPLHRLYNPNAIQAGAHHYTASEEERDMLIGVGWNYEGIGWFGVK